MDPLIGGALIAGGANLLGGFLTNSASAEAARQANYETRQMQEDAQVYHYQMSTNAYRHAVDDLRNSGINPMLAYMKGGAAAPGSSGSSAAPAQVKNPLEGVTGSALEAIRLKRDIDMMEAQRDKMKTDEDVNREVVKTQQRDQELKTASAKAAEAQAGLTKANEQIAQLEARLTRSALPKIEARNKFEAEHAEKLAPLDAIMERVKSLFQGASSAKDVFKNSPKDPKRNPIGIY